MKINSKYRFITFEGIEGSGKSTISRKLHEFLLANAIDNILTREPGGTKVGEDIRSILVKEKLSPISEVLLNFAARIEHVDKVIKPSLEKQKIVICDRFFHSTYAYQASAMGIDVALIDEVRKISINNFAPDIVFLIDLPIEIALKRTRSRADNNKYDIMANDFHQKVRQGFLTQAQNDDKIVVLDGTKTIDDIFAEAVGLITN